MVYLNHEDEGANANEYGLLAALIGVELHRCLGTSLNTTFAFVSTNLARGCEL
jgi:Flp pilus assembly pilin Flp